MFCWKSTKENSKSLKPVSVPDTNKAWINKYRGSYLLKLLWKILILLPYILINWLRTENEENHSNFDHKISDIAVAKNHLRIHNVSWHCIRQEIAYQRSVSMCIALDTLWLAYFGTLVQKQNSCHSVESTDKWKNATFCPWRRSSSSCLFARRCNKAGRMVNLKNLSWRVTCLRGVPARSFSMVYLPWGCTKCRRRGCDLKSRVCYLPRYSPPLVSEWLGQIMPCIKAINRLTMVDREISWQSILLGKNTVTITA